MQFLSKNKMGQNGHVKNNWVLVIISAEFESNNDVRCKILKKHWKNSSFLITNYFKFSIIPVWTAYNVLVYVSGLINWHNATHHLSQLFFTH